MLVQKKAGSLGGFAYPGRWGSRLAPPLRRSWLKRSSKFRARYDVAIEAVRTAAGI
jgi:hypothetical protein